MSKPWEATFSPMPHEVMEVLTDECGLDVSSVKFLGSGWDNDAFIVNELFVFRFPRREKALDLMRREILGLPYCAMGAIKVPIIEFSSLQSKTTGRPFVGYRLIEGESAGRLPLTDQEKRQLGRDLAEGLRALHSAEVPENVQRDLAAGNDWRIDVPARTELSLKRIMEDAAVIDSADLVRERLSPYSNIKVPPKRALVHGDLYPLHLIVAGGRLTGVIDWGDIHWGAPGHDLALFFGYLPEASVEDLTTIYGPLDEESMRFAAWRAACHATMVIPFAAVTPGLEILFAETKAGLERSLGWLEKL